MSHFTVENIIRQVGTYHNTAFRLLNTHSGIHPVAIRTCVRFIHHNPLPFFLQIVPIPIRENTFSPKWVVSNVGTQFIASTNLLKSLLACITCIVPLNKLGPYVGDEGAKEDLFSMCWSQWRPAHAPTPGSLID